MTFLRANDAVRIAHAIEAALDDPKSKESIHRVTSSDMTLATRQKSQGKDALWELDLYRRFKLAQTPVRFDEPDLVVSLGDEFGDYAVACKKAYSERSVAESLSEGCSQLLKHGRPGIVAFNLDDLLPQDSVWEEATRAALQARLDETNRKFLMSNAEHFTKTVERGSCDGILVSTTVISDVPEMSPRIQVSRSTAIWDYKSSSDAKVRFAAFRNRLDQVLHEQQ
ncbi:hypothetical protein [Paraburkholderia sp. J76]|uniref:hypothetical protein n=1 Tax=Paraburkholderia sp. J76 TaxID=2805439 RepID=UPI002ABE40D0|nr:hypothetical protein [Paraburkholderia sp. J76]